MQSIKTRLFGLVLVLVFAGITYYSWYQVRNEGQYSMKMAAFGPVGIVGGLFVMLFPGMAGKPDTTMQKVAVILVLVIGLAAGLLNWYLIDPGFFGK
jgi:hypothetical protein